MFATVRYLDLTALTLPMSVDDTGMSPAPGQCDGQVSVTFQGPTRPRITPGRSLIWNGEGTHPVEEVIELDGLAIGWLTDGILSEEVGEDG
ncbi:MAG: hypothetical protein ACRDT6_16075 [Micromonosporaceae bacterium]